MRPVCVWLVFLQVRAGCMQGICGASKRMGVRRACTCDNFMCAPCRVMAWHFRLRPKDCLGFKYFRAVVGGGGRVWHQCQTHVSTT